jgi:hypothetical protein
MIQVMNISVVRKVPRVVWLLVSWWGLEGDSRKELTLQKFDLVLAHALQCKVYSCFGILEGFDAILWGTPLCERDFLVGRSLIVVANEEFWSHGISLPDLYGIHRKTAHRHLRNGPPCQRYPIHRRYYIC